MKETFKDYKKTSGIYKITQQSTGKVYIGSTVNLYRRICTHINDLIKNKHHNTYLQRSYNKSQDFIYEIIEVCPENIMLDREQYWIDYYNSSDRSKGFNLSPVAGSNLGIKKTPEQIENFKIAIQGKHHCQTSLDTISEIKKCLNNGESISSVSVKFNVSYDYVRSIRRGKSYSYVEPQIIDLGNKSQKLSTEQVIEIKKLINMGYKVKTLSEQFNVSHRTISAIKNEIIWKNVGEKITVKKRKSKLNKTTK